MAVFIIAEAGVNHNGDLGMAMELVAIAAESGANAVKFQTFVPEKVASRNTPKASYQNKIGNVTHLDMLRGLVLDRDAHAILFEEARKTGIEFLSTPFDLESLDFLLEIGVSKLKLPSGEITNGQLISAMAKTDKQLIFSTGMCFLEDIKRALGIVHEVRGSLSDISLLHCTSEYPCPPYEVNLRAMEQMRQTFDLPIGYSDHTLGIEVSIAATALGASIIEKHFTLNRELEGPDHAASLNPIELSHMVRGIRLIETALGDGVKRPTASEEKNMRVVRKSVVAARDINKGKTIQLEDLCVKRPGTGISPMKISEIVGREAVKDFKLDDLIEL